ncbi:MAG: Asp-tRNA(Asn)/Glu-tRNA(Gln) amidotransferase GatCAB subunit B, partial [Cyanobacteria bacterium SZAS LIN-2]|nr:Asp-tRNA(Asn)/Glu-tRNA(Gln) amidotransferase GatCAB subunit B [Cyanobacteria bacterium SZAS LIN-2]
EKAIQSEIERQAAVLDAGQKVKQETRLWNENDGKTHPMRSKEESHDYRYFPDPDLMPVSISRDWVEEVAKTMPELPEQRRERYRSEHGLSQDDAVVIAEAKDMADLFDAVLKLGTPAKAAANYLIGPTNYYLNENKLDLAQTKLQAHNIKDLCQAVESGKLGSTKAKEVLVELLANGGEVAAIIESKGLAQVSDESAIKAMVQTVLDNNQSQLNDYKAGKVKLRQFFLGEVMKAARGKANPQVINKLLDELLPPVSAE